MVTIDEVMQEVFVALIDALRAWRRDARFTTFLYTIAQRKCIDHIRRIQAKRVLQCSLSPQVLRGLSVLIDGQIEQHELRAHIERIMKTLPHDYVLVLRLKYEDECSVKEIAQKLSMSVKSVESMLFRARRAFVTNYGRIVD
jgi:RNA polymerase sigma-70 factor (ECF subfamily)